MAATLTLAQFPPPKSMAEVKALYGDFEYTELSGGNVFIKGSWAHDNLVVDHNVLGTGLNIQLHKKVVPIFEYCLGNAMKATPQYAVRMLGGHCARHMLHDPKNPLSIHSWGAAFDINWDKNPVGPVLVTDLPASFIAAFTAEGWEWGGAWLHSKDAMHFQYATGI